MKAGRQSDHPGGIHRERQTALKLFSRKIALFEGYFFIPHPVCISDCVMYNYNKAIKIRGVFYDGRKKRNATICGRRTAKKSRTRNPENKRTSLECFQEKILFQPQVGPHDFPAHKQEVRQIISSRPHAGYISQNIKNLLLLWIQ
jgi:hypothetical protein